MTLKDFSPDALWPDTFNAPWISKMPNPAKKEIFPAVLSPLPVLYLSKIYELNLNFSLSCSVVNFTPFS